MKNKYIVASVAFLLVMFIVVMGVLPKLGVSIREQGQSYATDVFDQSKVTTVNITIDEADLQNILENPLEEKMYSADVVVNGEKVENVGLRAKGNLTLRSVAQMDDSDRYSWKIDFDNYVDGQNLHGLKKLNLNNNYSDPSQMREYLSYSLMKEMGVPTPAFSYMYVTINGKEWGLYLGVEAIEEPFLERNFENAKGDLYKPDGTGSDLKWISDDIKDYSGMNLKTNKDTKDQSELIAMLDAINHGGDIEKYLDVDEMLRYFAVNTAVVNLDHYQGNLKHNYYLYEEDGVFSILPWDYNMAFGGFGVGGMGGPGGMGGDMAANFMSDANINFSISTPVSGTTLADRPLLNALLSVDEYREKFNGYLQEIAQKYFTEAYMGTKTAEISDMILPYVEKDPTKFYTTAQFKESVSGEKSLVQFAVKRAASILAQLSGELVVEANTSSGMGGPGGQPPQMENGQDQGNLQPPQLGDGQAQGNGQNRGNRPPMDGGGPNGPRSQQSSGYSLETILMAAGAILLLIGTTVFALLYRRRRV